MQPIEVDRDEYPPLTEDFFRRAVVRVGLRAVSRGPDAPQEFKDMVATHAKLPPNDPDDFESKPIYRDGCMVGVMLCRKRSRPAS